MNENGSIVQDQITIDADKGKIYQIIKNE